MTETMLERLNAEIDAHRDYLERTLRECESYLLTYDKPTREEVGAPTNEATWQEHVAMIREMRLVVRGQLGLDPDSLEGMCHRLAEAGGRKQQQIARGRALVEAALMYQRGWRAKATKWLD